MEYDDNYGTCADTYATLRIYHDDLDLKQISRLLNLTPTEAHRKGDTQRGRRTGHITTLRIGSWLLRSDGAIDSRDSRRHVDWILDQLEGKAAIFETLRRQGCRTEIGCFWVSACGHGGPTLSPHQSRRLAELGLEFSYDIYFAGSDDDEDECRPPQSGPPSRADGGSG